MSKAKAKARKLKAKALQRQKKNDVINDKFSFTLKEVMQLCFNNTDVRKVEYTNTQLAPLQCHDNSRLVKESFEWAKREFDVDVECRIVEGWQIWEDKEKFTFNHHSVIEIDGKLVDTTPPIEGLKNHGFVEDLRNASDAWVYENILLMKKSKQSAKKNRLYTAIAGGKDFFQVSKDNFKGKDTFSPVKTSMRNPEQYRIIAGKYFQEAKNTITELLSSYVDEELLTA